MPTFNELLWTNGIDPRGVILLRHSGEKNKRTGRSPYTVWAARTGEFDRYQSTQPTGKFFENATCWASFIATPDKGTLFLGLYKPAKDDRRKITWPCPVSDLRPGQEKERELDLYALELMEALASHREVLRVEWGSGYRAWNQYAHDNDKLLVGVEHEIFTDFAESDEGRRVLRHQEEVERDPRISRRALDLNAARNGGFYACEACALVSADSGLFDVHHPRPLLCGPRKTKASDLVVLCPTCHRRAHRSSNPLLPYDLASLQGWVAEGRP